MWVSTLPSEPFKLISGIDSISFSQACGGEKAQPEISHEMLRLIRAKRIFF
jgi:hypothetical protein